MVVLLKMFLCGSSTKDVFVCVCVQCVVCMYAYIYVRGLVSHFIAIIDAFTYFVY